MKTFKSIAALIAVFGLLLLAFNISAAPAEVHALASGLPTIDPSALFGLGLAGTVGDMDKVMSLLDGIEAKMAKFAEKGELEAKAGTISTETKNAIDALGNQQKELADEILLLKQRAVADGDGEQKAKTAGELFTKSAEYEALSQKMAVGSRINSVGIEVKNTITNTVGNTFSDRRPGEIGRAHV